MLPHDSEGFLVGETITDIRRASRAIDDIRDDVSAIKAAVVSPSSKAKVAAVAVRQIERTRMQKDIASSVGRSVSKAIDSTDKQKAEKTANSRQSSIERSSNQSSAIETRRRDANGRFISSSVADIVEPGQEANRNKKGQFTSSSSTGKDERNSNRLFGSFADRIAKSFAEAETGLADVDPNVKAAQEIAQPLSKGYQAIFGGESDKKKFHWFSRIFRELKLSREESTVHAKAQKKVLDDIEEKTGGSAASGGGGGGFFPIFSGASLGTILPGLLKKMFTGIGVGVAAIFSPGMIKKVLLGATRLAFTPITIAAVAAWGIFTEDGRQFFSDMYKGWNNLISDLRKKFPLFDKLIDTVSRNVIEPVADGIEQIKKDSPKTMEFLDKAKSWVGNKFDQFKKSSPKTFGTDKKNKDILLNELDKQGITGKERAMFLAQSHHETGGFARMEEGFNYSARRLREVNKKARSLSPSELNNIVGGGQESIAEFMYGGRADLGNTQPGDGYKYRGRGFAQLTGRANYERIGKIIGEDLVNNPDLLLSDPEISARAAAAFHKSNSRLQKASKSGDVVAARRALNGGLNGIDDVRRLNDYYSTIQNSAIPEVKVPSMPALPVIQDSPGVLHPSKSKDDRQPFVSLPIDVGQDLSDRKIGLIATGGLNAL
ncbi:glycoside hydrolase family 19 protein [Methylotuvimicrobium sp. KM2]|uniref:glycoside hydrolase family 19 protein n=1 Tax=Methylotuvimicrobium sp. KM2 TaxID=3133976 RepID=UPI0031012890